MRARCLMCRRLLRRGITRGSLGALTGEFVWRELQRCPGCRAHYEKATRLWRLVASGGQSLSTPAALPLSLFASRVVARAVAAAPREHAPHAHIGAPSHLKPRAPAEAALPGASATDRRVPSGGPWQRLALKRNEDGRERSLPPGRRLVALAASGVLVLLVLVVLAPYVMHPPRDFAPRSAAAAPFAVRAFCHTLDVMGRPLIRALAEGESGPQELERCPADRPVSFAYLAERPASLVALAVSDVGQVLWLTGDGAQRLGAVGVLTSLGLELERAPSPETRALFFFFDGHADRARVAAALTPGATTSELARRTGALVVERWLRYDPATGDSR